MKQNTSGLSIQRADGNSKATTKVIGSEGENGGMGRGGVGEHSEER